MNMEILDSHEDLIAEKARLEGELGKIAVRSELNPKHWETKPPALDTDQADEGEQAFAMQEYEQNAAIVRDLEARLNEIDALLEKSGE